MPSLFSWSSGSFRSVSVNIFAATKPIWPNEPSGLSGEYFLFTAR